jgi:hypothetical protein
MTHKIDSTIHIVKVPVLQILSSGSITLVIADVSKPNRENSTA